MFESYEIKTAEKMQMVEIADLIKDFVKKCGILNGIVFVSVPHTTAGLTLNKNYDLVVQGDIMRMMDQIVPRQGPYEHIEGNSAAHILASIFGNTITLIVNDGHIELGMFQSVFLCEFDGPRKRKVHLKMISD